MKTKSKRSRSRATLVPKPVANVVAVAHEIATIQDRQGVITRRMEKLDAETERLDGESAKLETKRLGLLRKFDQVA